MSEQSVPITKADITAAIVLGRALIAEGVTKNKAAEAIYDSLTGADRATVMAAMVEATGMTQEEATKRHFYERWKPQGS